MVFDVDDTAGEVTIDDVEREIENLGTEAEREVILDKEVD